jgi:hypothetical protein
MPPATALRRCPTTYLYIYPHTCNTVYRSIIFIHCIRHNHRYWFDGVCVCVCRLVRMSSLGSATHRNGTLHRMMRLMVGRSVAFSSSSLQRVVVIRPLQQQRSVGSSVRATTTLFPHRSTTTIHTWPAHCKKNNNLLFRCFSSLPPHEIVGLPSLSPVRTFGYR